MNFDLIQELIQLDKKDDYSKSFLELDKIKKRFFKKDEMFVWNILFEILVADKIDNKSWAQKEIQKFIKMDPHTLIFSFNRLWVDNLEKKNKLYETINLSLRESGKIVSGQKEKLIFYSKVANYNDKSIKDFKNYSWTLEETRDLISQRDPVVSYMGYWKNILGNRVSRSELFQYLDQTMNTIYLLDFGLIDLWLLDFHFPNDDHRRSVIKKHIQKLAFSKDYYTRWILLELSKNSTIKGWLFEVDPEFSKPLFLLGRNFYKDLLNSGLASEFAIYNLMKLGDQDLEYLTWLSL